MKSLPLLLACLATPIIADAGPQPEVASAVQAHRDGRHGDALRIVKSQFNQIASCAKDAHLKYFITMFEWEQLLRDDAAARVAMINERDNQLLRVMAGDAILCPDAIRPISRVKVIIDMNRSLDDGPATYRMVTRLLQDNPALMRQEIGMALPAIVEAGDYSLAAKYLKNPLDRLDELNRQAQTLPLYPANKAPPRLAAQLSSFMGDVVLLSKVLKGLKQDAEADALRRAALTGIQSEELRTLATREFDEPGTITKTMVEHQMAQENGPALAPGPQ